MSQYFFVQKPNYGNEQLNSPCMFPQLQPQPYPFIGPNQFMDNRNKTDHPPIMTVRHYVYRLSILPVKRYVIEEDRFIEVFEDPCCHRPRPQSERYVLQVDCHSDDSWLWSFRLPFKLLNSDFIGRASLPALRNDVPWGEFIQYVYDKIPICESHRREYLF
jgi:hypothetical protein